MRYKHAHLAMRLVKLPHPIALCWAASRLR
jgi:hypothetical protein